MKEAEYKIQKQNLEKEKKLAKLLEQEKVANKINYTEVLRRAVECSPARMLLQRKQEGQDRVQKDQHWATVRLPEILSGMTPKDFRMQQK